MLQRLTRAFDSTPPSLPVQLRIGELTLPAEVTNAVSLLDTTMEAVLLCNCHGEPVISAASLAAQGGVSLQAATSLLF